MRKTFTSVKASSINIFHLCFLDSLNDGIYFFDPIFKIVKRNKHKLRRANSFLFMNENTMLEIYIN